MAQKDIYDSSYVFSSEQQREVRNIYQKYRTPGAEKETQSEEDAKLERLRKLDKSVTAYGSAAGVFTGVCGGMIHGVGTALVQSDTMFAAGTVIAVIGLILFLAAYPVCSFVVKKRRQKVETEILQLCRELMK